MLPLRVSLLTVLVVMLSTASLAQSRLVYEGGWTDTASGEAIVSLPEGYDADPDRDWPLLLFLHGAGERGDSLAAVGVHGPLKERAAGRDLPFVIVAPQVPTGSRWTVGRVAAALDAAIAQYRVDERRVYLTGLSMGGFGTWEAIMRMPDRFAAAVPICGGGLPLGMSVGMVRTLRNAGGNVRFTVYPDAGHDSWSEAYASDDLYTWLLSHHLDD